ADVVAVPKDGAATVTWAAANDNGGGAITGYIVTALNASQAERPVTVSGATFTATLTGLRDGTSYQFMVQATNATGAGLLSRPSATVTPDSLPQAPRNVLASMGTASVSIMWGAPPPTGGGSPILSYIVTASPGNVTTTVSASSTY